MMIIVEFAFAWVTFSAVRHALQCFIWNVSIHLWKMFQQKTGSVLFVNRISYQELSIAFPKLRNKDYYVDRSILVLTDMEENIGFWTGEYLCEKIWKTFLSFITYLGCDSLILFLIYKLFFCIMNFCYQQYTSMIIKFSWFFVANVKKPELTKKLK